MTDLLLSAPERRAVLVEVPELPFLMIDGTGDPKSGEFATAIQTLFKASYAIHFRLHRHGVEHPVPPLETLWDLDWNWTAMIRQPEQVTPGLLRELKIPPAVRLEHYAEGLAVQTLHVGPFAQEDRAVALLAAYADDHGYRFTGRHHEIYLSDPRRTAPGRLQTIVRHPVAQVSSSSTWPFLSPTAGSVRTSRVGA